MVLLTVTYLYHGAYLSAPTVNKRSQLTCRVETQLRHRARDLYNFTRGTAQRYRSIGSYLSPRAP